MASDVRRIALVGSTGSIGRQVLDVVRALPERFRVIALAAGQNAALLAEQAAEFRPAYLYCSAEMGAIQGVKFIPLEELASLPEADIVLIAASGKAGLRPVLAAVSAGKVVALANKESLVVAGEIINAGAARSSAELRPVDSEHSAIWQCLKGEDGRVERLILTASGGPFVNHSQKGLSAVTVEEALAHPSWKMGKKVTVDSATLLNKGLEVIEAHWLFNMAYDSIEVLVHPQSVVHSMVEFADGSIKAQLSFPDMRLPIQYALTCPERLSNGSLPRLDWGSVSRLDFRQPDYKQFPCLGMAVEAGRKGGTYPAALCAADEVAVELFLAGGIGFMGIPRLIEGVLAWHKSVQNPSIEEVEAADIEAREKARQIAGGGNL
jgi:1-deoxy-D-xylulose-5-phosphate reductoisomerase